VPVRHQEFDLELRVRGEERCQTRHHLVRAEGDRQRHPQDALQPAGAARDGSRFAELEQHATRPLQIGGAGLGQRQPARGTDQQPDAEAVLQCGDQARYRRLRQS
jgi:hypothetical protein